MWQVNLNPKLNVGLILALFFLQQCKMNCDEHQMMKSLSKQKVECIEFIDSLKLEVEPHHYNSQYGCLALVKLNEKAPSILKRYWCFWKTYSVDSVGYASFDDFFKLIGIPKNKALIITETNRERTYFSLLTFEENGVKIGLSFLVLENTLDDTNCLELDYQSINFKGQKLGKKIKISAEYSYISRCKNIDNKAVKSIFWVRE